MSLATSGSAFSFMVTAAVVCGTKRKHMPSMTALRRNADFTSDVMSIISARTVVFTLRVSSIMRMIIAYSIRAEKYE